MSKTVRWIFYGLLIVGSVAFGLMVTYQQNPQSYAPVPDDVRMHAPPTSQSERD